MSRSSPAVAIADLFDRLCFQLSSEARDNRSIIPARIACDYRFEWQRFNIWKKN